MLSARLSSDVCHLVCALHPRFCNPIPGRAGFGTRLWPLVACQSPVRLLDCFIVATSVWDVLVDILTALLDENGFESVSGLSTLKAFRVVRVTRVLKIAQLLRIFRFVMALRTLVQSIFHTLKALVWALLLLLLIVLLGQHVKCKRHGNGCCNPCSPGPCGIHPES